jgi:hypothetical protein
MTKMNWTKTRKEKLQFTHGIIPTGLEGTWGHEPPHHPPADKDVRTKIAPENSVKRLKGDFTPGARKQ